MKKNWMLYIALVMMVVGCKKVTVDFTYSPAEPKAGETIRISNQSSAGESWHWTFGDNTTSKTKNPTKVYQKPGKYAITLMVDSAKNKSLTKTIQVYDTVPTFVASEDSILLYHDVRLGANVYNPFGYSVTFQWTLPESAVLLSGELDDPAIVVYFTEQGTSKVQLAITLKDKVYNAEKDLAIHNVKAPAILMRQADKSVMRQRMIDDRLEAVSAGTAEDKALMADACDSVVVFNGVTFYASQMSQLIPGFAEMDILHMQMDAMAQKWYVATADGLFVANMDGSDIVSVDATATGAVYVDASRNRVYWANTTGVYAMPLVKSKNNQFTTTPIQYNNLNTIDLITVNNTLQ